MTYVMLLKLCISTCAPLPPVLDFKDQITCIRASNEAMNIVAKSVRATLGPEPTFTVLWKCIPQKAIKL